MKPASRFVIYAAVTVLLNQRTSTTTPLKVSVAGKRREQEQACRCEDEESLNQHRSWESNIADVFSIRSFHRSVVGAERGRSTNHVLCTGENSALCLLPIPCVHSLPSVRRPSYSPRKPLFCTGIRRCLPHRLCEMREGV